jgi:hypothetical protein
MFIGHGEPGLLHRPWFAAEGLCGGREVAALDVRNLWRSV